MTTVNFKNLQDEINLSGKIYLRFFLQLSSYVHFSNARAVNSVAHFTFSCHLFLIDLLSNSTNKCLTFYSLL